MFLRRLPNRGIFFAAWLGSLVFLADPARAGTEVADRHWRLAESYLEKAMVRHALAEAKVVLKLDPGHVRARALLDAHDSGAGGKPSPEGLYIEALRAYRQGRISAAVRFCGEILAKDPAHGKARDLKAAMEEEIYRPVPLAANDVLRELFEQAVGFYRREEWEAALDAFSKGLAADPGNAQFGTFHDRCRVKWEAGEIAGLLMAAENAHVGGRNREAREALLKVLAIRPNHAEALALRERWGLGPEAEARRVKARMHFNRGVEAYEQGRWEDSVREWELVTGLIPDDEEANRLLRKARGKLAAAKRKARKRTAELHQEALRQFQHGKRDEARRTYMRILEIDPDDEKARKNLMIVDGNSGSD